MTSICFTGKECKDWSLGPVLMNTRVIGKNDLQSGGSIQGNNFSPAAVNGANSRQEMWNLVVIGYLMYTL